MILYGMNHFRSVSKQTYNYSITQQVVDELLRNGSNRNDVFQNFENEDTTTTLIINGMKENKSI